MDLKELLFSNDLSLFTCMLYLYFVAFVLGQIFHAVFEEFEGRKNFMVQGALSAIFALGVSYIFYWLYIKFFS
ncbi:MAG: hypothetical protein AAB497_02710 [Patescibacteria group bacterium]